MPKGREGVDTWDIFTFWMVSKAECFCQVTQPERVLKTSGALPPHPPPILPDAVGNTTESRFQPGTRGSTSCALSQELPDWVAWTPKRQWWGSGTQAGAVGLLTESLGVPGSCCNLSCSPTPGSKDFLSSPLYRQGNGCSGIWLQARTLDAGQQRHVSSNLRDFSE